MARYINNSSSGALSAVEFADVGAERFSFLHIKPGADSAAIETLLASPPLSLGLISRASEAGGGMLLVARGNAAPEGVLAALRSQGESLVPPLAPAKKLNPWAWRGYTSILGQGLQLMSGFKTVGGTAADRWAIVGFATLNMIANLTNVMVGAQKKPDPHQLRFLKQQVNQQFAPDLSANDLPAIDEAQLAIRKQHHDAPEKTIGNRLHEWIEKYSVSGGEIGLRTIGSASLAFPVTSWKAGVKTLRETKSLTAAFRTIRNPNPVTFGVGLMMLTGKFTSLASKEPDPYNPKPPTMLDRFREKVTFPLSSIIEGSSAVWMATDRYKRQKIMIGGKPVPDYYGTAGNAVFVGGYGMRLMATYGTREVDMAELNAHITEALAKAPREKLPAMLSSAAMMLQQHFAAKNIPLSTYYTDLLRDLAEHHHITLPPSSVSLAQQSSPSASVGIPSPQSEMPRTQLQSGHKRVTEGVGNPAIAAQPVAAI